MVLHIANRRKEHHSNQQRHLMKPNLSSLSDNEINSGKIWTLLRHNKQFEEDANWFSGRYKKATSKRVKQENRQYSPLSLCFRGFWYRSRKSVTKGVTEKTPKIKLLSINRLAMPVMKHLLLTTIAARRKLPA